MLDGYFDYDNLNGEALAKRRKRLLAVQAALEIAKASAASSDNSEHSRVDDDMKEAAKYVSSLADAIQAALD